MKLTAAIGKYAWFIILPMAFLIYSNSFSGFPALEKDHSILGESDAAAFIVLITDFSLEKQYGDPYRLEGRRLEDVAQKHKLHHILYVMVASVLYHVLSIFYKLFGLSAEHAVYAINATLGCINIFLLYELLKQIDPGKKQKGIFLLLYAFCLSSWIFHSVPESWPFSATLLLFFLVLHYNKRINPFALAVYVGIAMLNNVFLGTLCFFLIILFWVESDSVKAFLTKSLGAIVVAIATWLSAMTLLSVFDGGFRPDHFFHYTMWFKKTIAPPVILSDSYYWKSAFTNLYINTILSNQSNPNVPNEALLYTFQQSRIGLTATIVYLFMVSAVGHKMIKYFISQLKDPEGQKKLLAGVDFPLAIYICSWFFLTVIMDPGGGFLYSTIVIPLMLILLFRFTDWQLRYHRILTLATLVAVLINNTQQVIKFRHALLIMSQ